MATLLTMPTGSLAPDFSIFQQGKSVFGSMTPKYGEPGSGTGMTISNLGATASSSTQSLATALGKVGPLMAIFGAVNSAVGSFYAAKTAQYQAKSQALNMQFQSDMAKSNARQAEYQAQQILFAGERQVGQYTMRAGQAKASAQASLAARGIQAGVGSAKEVIASMDIMKETDALTINANTVRAAEAARTQKQNYLTQASMAGVSAENMLASAQTISPGMAGFTSLLGSASSIGQNWASDRRLAAMLARAGV